MLSNARPGERRRRRFAESLSVVAGEAAEVKEAAVHGDPRHRRFRTGRLKGIPRGLDPSLMQGLHRRAVPGMAERRLQGANADAGNLRQVVDGDRIGEMRIHPLFDAPDLAVRCRVLTLLAAGSLLFEAIKEEAS